MNFDREALQWFSESRVPGGWKRDVSNVRFVDALRIANHYSFASVDVRIGYEGKGGRVFRSKSWSKCVVLETDDGNPELDEGAAE